MYPVSPTVVTHQLGHHHSIVIVTNCQPKAPVLSGIIWSNPHPPFPLFTLLGLLHLPRQCRNSLRCCPCSKEPEIDP